MGSVDKTLVHVDKSLQVTFLSYCLVPMNLQLRLLRRCFYQLSNIHETSMLVAGIFVHHDSCNADRKIHSMGTI